MPQTEIDAVRALLSAKPRPVGWEERRRRIEEVGAVWPVADDVKLEPVDLDGVKGEWSIVPGADASRVADLLSWRRLLLGFDRQPPPIGDRGRTGRGPAHPGPRLSPRARASLSGRPRRRAHRLAAPAPRRLRGEPDCGRRRQRGREFDARSGRGAQARRRGPAWLSLASVAVGRSHHVGGDAREQKRRRSAHPEGVSGGAGRRLCPGGHGPEGPAPLASLRGSQGAAADPHSDRFGRDPARRRRPLRRRRWRGRRLRDPRNLAAHDPRLAALERPSRARPPRARPCGRVLQGTPVGAGSQACACQSRAMRARKSRGRTRVREPGG